MDELLDRIAAGPVDAELELLRVYADQLILRGDPLGELIVVATDRLRHDTPERSRREDALIAERIRELTRALGRPGTYRWRRGFLDSASFQHTGDQQIELVFPILAMRPDARLLRRIEIHGLEYDGQGDLGPTFATLARLAPQFSRLTDVVVGVDLDAGNPWVDGPLALRDVSPLYAAYPALELLELDGARIELGDIVLPNLRRLLATRLAPDDARRIVAAELPRLVDLELGFYPRDVDNVAACFGPLLHRRFPHLEALSLALPTAEMQLWLMRELPDAPIARGVRHLAFRHARIDARCMELLLADRSRYPRLERLELRHSTLSASLQKRLLHAFGSALVLV